MNTATNEMLHKFLQLGDKELSDEVAKLNGRIVQMQRSKAHKTADGRQALSVFQSQLHSMKMEQKRREGEAKRAKHNG